MLKTLKYSASILVLSVTPSFAEFNDVGTDYSNAAVNKWSEDSINDYVSMANAFACILQNARPDKLPNATYEALISEVECGLTDEEVNRSGVSNRGTLSSSTMVNSRASATSNQEGQFWFNSLTGAKYIGGLTMKQSPTDLPPYGEWGLSFYLNSMEGSAEFTSGVNGTSPSKGYVDISDSGGGSVTLKTYDKWYYDNDDFGYQTAKILYSDATLNSTKILGRTGETRPEGSRDRLVAAQTNATHVFRAVSDDGGNTFTGSCMKRDSTWQTGHDYGVYNKSTGTKVSLSGGFGFNYTEDGTTYRGYLGSRNVHFDNPATAFSPSSPTKTVTRQSDGATFTLSWAPGKLEERTLVTEALSATETTTFKTHTENEGRVEFRITKNGANFEGKFYKSDGTQVTDPYNGIAGDDVITTADLSSNSWLGSHLWSDEKRTDVFWDGGSDIKFYSDIDVSADSTLLGASYTALVARYDNSAGSNLPVAAAAWRAASDSWGYTNKSDSKDDRYFFTGLNPPTGYLPRTLYTDPSGNGPVANATDDKAVMFNFSGNEREKTFKSFADNSSATLADSDGNINPWPYKSIELEAAVGSKIYRWSFGAFNWDNSIIAQDASNVIYSMDPPLTLTYVHAAAKDMNEGKTITFFADPSNNPVPHLCPLDSGTPKCVITPTSFGTKTFKLKYDGSWLEGLPNTNGRAATTDKNSFWIRMVNPEAGTVVTAADNTEYVLKPLAIGEAFLPADNASDCDAISFSTRAEFGWELSDLPALADYPLPTANWASKPATSELQCTVTMGDASACP
ncbi:hypothetical protein N9568_02850 [Planktomarina temperata]|nr:hypothetical protein [Planktomarina temperata]